MIQRVGASSCIRCDFKTNASDSFDKQDADMMAHLTDKHPGWMFEGLTSTGKEAMSKIEAPVEDTAVELPQNRIDEITQRLSMITPGPWEMRLNGCTASILLPDGKAIALLQQVQKPHVPLNAEFIAHAPADTEYLLARTRELEKRLAEAETLLSTVENDLELAAIRDAPLPEKPRSYDVDSKFQLNEPVYRKVDVDPIFATLARQVAENLELKKLAPRWQSQADGVTHSEGCWQDHRGCALARIADLEAQLKAKGDAGGWIANSEAIHEWMGCEEVNDFFVSTCSCGWTYQHPNYGSTQETFVNHWGDHVLYEANRELRDQLKESQEECFEMAKLCHKYQDVLWTKDKLAASREQPHPSPPQDEAKGGE